MQEAKYTPEQKSDIPDIEEAVEKLNQGIADIDKNIAKVKKEIFAIKNMDEIIPPLKRQLEKYQVILIQLENSRTETENKIFEIRAREKQLIATKNKEQELEESIQIANTQIEKLEKEKQELMEEVAEEVASEEPLGES